MASETKEGLDTATNTKVSEKSRIEEIKPEVDDDIQSCRTFVIHNEDHTLGNSLRYIVLKDRRVEFCGYSVPHPSEDKINFRIQTDGSCSAEDALRTGLDNLYAAAEVLLEKFDKAVGKHTESLDKSMDQC